ncbi:MAG: hydroxyethylthiazole kinase [Bilifractor sp.]
MPENTSVITKIRNGHPLIHAITNAVTINDVTNMLLAAGAVAICSDNPEETADIVSLCNGLLLNTGMPCDSRLAAMIAAGSRANEKGIPVVLDPVGAGASSYRTRYLSELFTYVHMDLIRGNMSEIVALGGLAIRSRGVEDCGIEGSMDMLRRVSEKFDAVIVATGETDYVVYRDRVLENHTGTRMLKRITGAGCMLSGLLSASSAVLDRAEYKSGKISAWKRALQDAAWDMVHTYGLCAEQAEKDMLAGSHQGTITFRNYLIDAISTCKEHQM